MYISLILLLAVSAHARMSVMYAHDSLSDYAVEQCLTEMFPKNKLKSIQESDEPCIIFCVLKKFGIMTNGGTINLNIYKHRLLKSRYYDLDQNRYVSDYGQDCYEKAESTQHKVDVCKKAKVFNDCTHLYKVLLK